MLTDKLEHELELLERNLVVLKTVIKEEPIGILKLAEETSLPKHKVRYSLRLLEHEGLVEPSLHGAITTTKMVQFKAEFGPNMKALIQRLNRISQSLS
ncbi:MAG: hypothetical protein PHS47_02900 [Methanocellales archaeon]|nr:hypothetical protein [Methanocellales archaeon]MDD3421230.1 hypothetical protein [Methanocellales archaeon]MDD4898393.1 hypothetical protein [Methanocellales archaeon]MDD5447025.1 hypothetical protein [Methanocellales archaeon]